MNKKLLIIMPVLLLASCGSRSSIDTSEDLTNPTSTDLIINDSTTEDQTTTNDSTTSGEIENTDISNISYEELFNPASDVKFEIKFTNEVILKFASYATDNTNNHCDTYHPVDVKLTLNGKVYHIEEAGARMKGNTSKNPGFVDENGQINDQVHYKISFKQTFDKASKNDYYTHDWSNDPDGLKARKKRTLAGMEKIDFKWNKNYDKTFTKQTYALNMFVQEDMLAQKSNLVSFDVASETNEMEGTYEMLECIDEAFLNRRLPEAQQGGDLYKCSWGSAGDSGANLSASTKYSIGVESPKDNQFFKYDKKTNDEAEGDEDIHENMKKLIDVVNTSDSAGFNANDLKDIVDLDQYVKFEALNWLAGNPDDLRNNANNYYIYFMGDTNKAVFIPYDYDRCFGILKDYEKDMTTYSPTSNKAASNNDYCQNPLAYRTIISSQMHPTFSDYSLVDDYQTTYILTIAELAPKYLNVESFKEFNNSFVYSGSYSESDGGSNNQTFGYYANAKSDQIVI